MISPNPARKGLLPLLSGCTCVAAVILLFTGCDHGPIPPVNQPRFACTVTWDSIPHPEAGSVVKLYGAAEPKGPWRLLQTVPASRRSAVFLLSRAQADPVIIFCSTYSNSCGESRPSNFAIRPQTLYLGP